MDAKTFSDLITAKAQEILDFYLLYSQKIDSAKDRKKEAEIQFGYRAYDYFKVMDFYSSNGRGFSYTFEEVSELEKMYAFSFPEFYKAFLLSIARFPSYFGRSYDPFELLSIYKGNAEQISNFPSFEPYFKKGLLFYFVDFHGAYEFIDLSSDDPNCYFSAVLEDTFGYNIKFSEVILWRLDRILNFLKFGTPFDEQIHFTQDGLPFMDNLRVS